MTTTASNTSAAPAGSVAAAGDTGADKPPNPTATAARAPTAAAAGAGASVAAAVAAPARIAAEHRNSSDSSSGSSSNGNGNSSSSSTPPPATPTLATRDDMGVAHSPAPSYSSQSSSVMASPAGGSGRSSPDTTNSATHGGAGAAGTTAHATSAPAGSVASYKPGRAPSAFAVDRAQFKRGKGTNGVLRVCILDIAKGFTLEVTRASDLEQNNAKAKADGKAEAAPAPAAAVEWPHDTDEAIRELEPTAEIEHLYLTPDPRKSVGAIRRRAPFVDVFVNQYDLSDNTGQAICDFMDKNGIAFTGGGARFYDPPREDLKRLCRYYGIDTPMYTFLSDTKDIEKVPEELGGFPLFVKPEHGYDSVGIDTNSVVSTLPAFTARVKKICEEFGSALVEKFVDGREFSVLVAGTKGRIQTFPAVEYEFAPERRRKAAEAKAAATVAAAPAVLNGQPVASDAGVPAAFITFQDKWGSSYSCHWVPVKAHEAKLGNALETVASKLFEAFEGEGVARMDIRVDEASGKLMVLDINPNPSLFYKDECTADTLLRYCGWRKSEFMAILLDHALARSAKWHAANSNTVPKYAPGKGFSLQAARDLKEGQMIYSDEMNPLRLVTREYVLQRWPTDELNTFQAYCWPVGENTYAIWDVEPKHWKPINHSCDPNCWMTGLEVRARRNIPKGEELTLDYATFLPHHPPFDCWCGAKTCRKKMKPAEYREPQFEATYRGHYTPYIHSQLQHEKQLFDVVKCVLTGQTAAATQSGALPNASAAAAAGAAAGEQKGAAANAAANAAAVPQSYNVTVSDEQIKALITALTNAKVEAQFQEIKAKTTQTTEGVTSVNVVAPPQALNTAKADAAAVAPINAAAHHALPAASPTSASSLASSQATTPSASPMAGHKSLSHSQTLSASIPGLVTMLPASTAAQQLVDPKEGLREAK